MDPQKFYENYRSHGFLFPEDLLTTYCLSLHSKPFVILSGISGTGKTKIAQLFSYPLLEELTKNAAAEKASPDLPGKWILMTVTDGVIAGDGRANFKYQDLEALLSETEVKSIQPRIEELKRKGLDDNICPPFDFTIDTPDGTKLKATAYLQRAKSPLLRIRFRSKRGEPDYDSTTYFAKNYKVGDVLKLEKIGDKQLRIASINDKAVVAKAQELERKEIRFVTNTCFIPVRSDWTDSTPLFGYYNLVEQKYHVTPLIEFLLTAIEFPEIPFFLILDEMNLSRVEHYFSDFLSCVESRHYRDSKLIQESIRLHTGTSWLDTDNLYFDVIPSQLRIPTNLYVTGTINVDETTYMFSPKVLDRANVIEFNEVNFKAYAQGAAPASKHEFALKEFPNFSHASPASIEDFKALKEEAKILLGAVHAVLAQYNLHFGYRTLNEAARYINSALRYCKDSPHTLDAALDYQIYQKILPKLNGSQGKLDLPIRALLRQLSVGDSVVDGFGLEQVQAMQPEKTKYPMSVSKLMRMYLALSTNGFTSFVE